MEILVLGLLLFLGIHSVPMNVALKGRLTETLGGAGYRGAFTLVAALGLGLLIWGYGLARENSITIYHEQFVLRHLTLLLMLPVFVLLAAAYIQGNIKKVLKHPMILAVKLWAVAHLLVNGNLEDLLLFGSFLVWGVLQIISQKKRGNSGPVTLKSANPWINDIIAVVVGLGVYVLFVFVAHEWITGKALIP